MTSMIQVETKIKSLPKGWLVIDNTNYTLTPRRAGHLGLVPEDAPRCLLERLAADQANPMRAIRIGDDPILDAAAANFASWLENEYEEKAESSQRLFRIDVKAMPLAKIVDLTILTMRSRGWDVVVPGRSTTGKDGLNSGAFYLSVA